MGLQYSTYCFCGNSYGKHGPVTGCGMKCGGSLEMCGGSSHNSVYQLRDDGSGIYLGCFKDDNVVDLAGAHLDRAAMTVSWCVDWCKNQGPHRYFSSSHIFLPLTIWS